MVIKWDQHNFGLNSMWVIKSNLNSIVVIRLKFDYFRFNTIVVIILDYDNLNVQLNGEGPSQLLVHSMVLKWKHHSFRLNYTVIK